MDSLFVSDALLKSQVINRFALMANKEESCTLYRLEVTDVFEFALISLS